MNRTTACRIIANCMTNKGFMNGWFGDDSSEFKAEQALAIERLKRGHKDVPYTADWWAEKNMFNMVRYCHIPKRVIDIALGMDTEIPLYMLKPQWVLSIVQTEGRAQ